MMVAGGTGAPEALRDQIAGLEGEIARHLDPRPADHVPSMPFMVTPIARHASHTMAIVTSTADARRKLLLKGLPRHTRVHQDAETERRVLSEITPRIAETNPRLRSPRVIAHYPERSLLVLEFFEGVTLDALLFAVRPPKTVVSGSAAIRLAAEWLASFHRITASGEQGDPFAFLQRSYERPRIARMIQDYLGADVHREIMSALSAARDRYAGHREPLCTTHGEFAPYHLLVGNDGICVIDLASSRMGYAFDDLAFFAASYDALLPWRRALGAARAPLEQQQRLFVDVYTAATAPLSEPTRVAARFARILAYTRFASRMTGRDTWKRHILALSTRWWVRRTFLRVCRNELDALWAHR